MIYYSLIILLMLSKMQNLM